MESYSTISEMIESGKLNNLTYYNLSILQKEGNTIYSVDNVLYDYIDELKSVAEVVELTDEEFIKYQYNPELLAKDIYGSEELFFIILLINNLPIGSAKEFNMKKIKMIRSEACLYFLNSIYNKEKEYLESSRLKIV